MNENLILITVKKEELENLIENAVQNAVKQNVKAVEPDQLMTRQQTADFLSVNLATLWRYTKSGVLPAHQIGNRVYYKRSEILESLECINPKKKGGEK